MNLIHEYALLIAVALPVVVVAVLNVWLALNGERDTLLLPVPEAAERSEDLAPLRHAA